MTRPSLSQLRAHFLWHHFLLLMKTKIRGKLPSSSMSTHIVSNHCRVGGGPVGWRLPIFLGEKGNNTRGQTPHALQTCFCKRRLSLLGSIRLNVGYLKSPKKSLTVSFCLMSGKEPQRWHVRLLVSVLPLAELPSKQKPAASAAPPVEVTIASSKPRPTTRNSGEWSGAQRPKSRGWNSICGSRPIVLNASHHQKAI